MLVKYSSFGNMDNNCYLIVDEKTNKSALVDCTEYSEKMINLIGDTELEYILLTHGHCDHIAGAKQIKEKYNAKIVISSPDIAVSCELFILPFPSSTLVLISTFI